MSLAAVVREAVNWASNAKLLCLALQQSRYRQGPCEHGAPTHPDCRTFCFQPVLPLSAPLNRPAVIKWFQPFLRWRQVYNWQQSVLEAISQPPEPSTNTVSSLATASSSPLGPLYSLDEGRSKGIGFPFDQRRSKLKTALAALGSSKVIRSSLLDCPIHFVFRFLVQGLFILLIMGMVWWVIVTAWL